MFACSVCIHLIVVHFLIVMHALGMIFFSCFTHASQPPHSYKTIYSLDDQYVITVPVHAEENNFPVFVDIRTCSCAM